MVILEGRPRHTRALTTSVVDEQQANKGRPSGSTGQALICTDDCSKGAAAVVGKRA
jgi:hypothetical protein